VPEDGEVLVAVLVSRLILATACLSATAPVATMIATPASAKAGCSQAMAGRDGLRAHRARSRLRYRALVCRAETIGDAVAATAATCDISHRRARDAGLLTAARPAVAAVNAGSTWIVISQARSFQSVTSSDTRRTSHGAASRRTIRVRPSSAGSTRSAAACSARRRASSKSSAAGVLPSASGSFRPSPACLTCPAPGPPAGPQWRGPCGPSPSLC
jgi:hypothetical protein